MSSTDTTTNTDTKENISNNLSRPVQLPLVDSTTWGRELIQKFESGVSHAFILHGNVEDYVGGAVGEQIVAALIKRFARNREVVPGKARNLSAREKLAKLASPTRPRATIAAHSQPDSSGRKAGLPPENYR